MKHLVVILIYGISLLSFPYVYSQDITSWQTSGNQSQLLKKQSDIIFNKGSGSSNTQIHIRQDVKFQEIDGFGWTLTQGSAKLINNLPEALKNELLNELFNTTTGLGSNIVRIGIGATDLSEKPYTYHESANDLNLEKFSLNGPDNDYLIPILKKIVEINPNVKILATPWTAPTWMKTNTNDNNKYIGGKLNEKYYASYANYFIKYFEAMRVHGIKIWAITPQNEPLHDGNEPSMKMTKEEQYNFIHNHLGPSIENSEFKHIKIIAYDHNCDNTDYPVYVSKSKYVDGSAFHLYDEESNVNALTDVYNTTGKKLITTL